MNFETIKNWNLSSNKALLSAAIGKPLTSIERLFNKDLAKQIAVHDLSGLDQKLFFSYSNGATQFSFGDEVIHSFAPDAGTYSILFCPEQLTDGFFDRLYNLSEVSYLACDNIQHCIGKICLDVRIWKFNDGYDPGDLAMESGISYLLSNGFEIFYCTHIHKEYDEDYVLLKDSIDISKVASCFSVGGSCFLPL
jgi:hypothetical protein